MKQGESRPLISSSAQGATSSIRDSLAETLDLTLPGFRDDDGNLFIAPTMRYVAQATKATDILGREPMPQGGHAAFIDAALKFAYGDNKPYRSRRIAGIQVNTLSTALRLASSLISRALLSSLGNLYVPNTLPESDRLLFADPGFSLGTYRLSNANGLVEFFGMSEDLGVLSPGSAILLHVGGAWQIGTDLTSTQWRLLTTILKEKQLVPFIVMPDQGLGSGEPDRDAHPVRYMAHEGLPVVLVQTFDAVSLASVLRSSQKILGLYADSPAVVSVSCESEEDKGKVDLQLRAIADGMHCRPTPWGAHYAHVILSDAKLQARWCVVLAISLLKSRANEVKTLSRRLQSVRNRLADWLDEKLQTPGSWDHIRKSSGMYW